MYIFYRLHRASLVIAFVAIAIMCSALAHAASTKTRVVILTDIGNEPDDSESMVRFLLYANEFDVEGLLATTSIWQKDKVHPELIEERVHAYGQVLSNLRKHAPDYPDAEKLASTIRSGEALYGMQGVKPGHHTPASDLIVAALEKPDPRPLWVCIWGGARELAQALTDLRAKYTRAKLDALLGKLRVYSISDQDDAGPWIRRYFPDVFWIASIHGFSQYGSAAWIGISSRPPTVEGADETLVSHEWLEEHIRKGPLGSLYPQWQFIMEGDTPSFLYLVPNGLGDPEHPDYGSWGGRYVQVSAADGLYADTTDTIVGSDGKLHRNNKATIWRWREAYQNDFAARMSWTLAASYEAANHPPQIVVNGERGVEPIVVTVAAGQWFTLDATGTRDPDGNALHYRWFEYTDLNPAYSGSPPLTLDEPTSTRVKVLAPKSTTPARHHIILQVQDTGEPAITRYRRIIVNIESR